MRRTKSRIWSQNQSIQHTSVKDKYNSWMNANYPPQFQVSIQLRCGETNHSNTWICILSCGSYWHSHCISSVKQYTRGINTQVVHHLSSLTESPPPLPSFAFTNSIGLLNPCDPFSNHLAGVCGLEVCWFLDLPQGLSALGLPSNLPPSTSVIPPTMVLSLGLHNNVDPFTVIMNNCTLYENLI